MKQLQPDHIYLGDVLTEIKKIPAKSVRCCVTSPPYYGLRDELGMFYQPQTIDV